MSILNFLRPEPLPHPAFGTLEYAGGHWRGTLTLDGRNELPLFVPGTRKGPDAEGLRVAELVETWWTNARPRVQAELFEHYSAGREANDGGEYPQITDSAAVWLGVKLSSVQVKPYRTLSEIQVALNTTWDEEHTLGVLIRDEQIVELNGSILEPR